MSFLRPEALAALRRWRETALALVAASFGLWLTLRGGVFYGVLGAVVIAASLGLALTAWRRLRFGIGGAAPGLVQIDEGAIAYFGPETGGIVALSELEQVEALTEEGRLAWRLTQSDGRGVTIPAEARGAEALFDVLAALPGVTPGQILAVRQSPPAGRRRIWRRRPGDEPRLPGA
jgi:hypothetical protein